jgi:hypothetical protein
MFNDFMVNFKNEFGGNIPRDQASAIGKLQDMFEKDFTNMMKLDSEIDDAILGQVKKKYATAVEFFADTTKNFEGGIVTDFRQMNKSMFGPGAEQRGYMYTGEAFNGSRIKSLQKSWHERRNNKKNKSLNQRDRSK